MCAVCAVCVPCARRPKARYSCTQNTVHQSSAHDLRFFLMTRGVSLCMSLLSTVCCPAPCSHFFVPFPALLGFYHCQGSWISGLYRHGGHHRHLTIVIVV